MGFTGFSASDFKVFDLQGFQPRMSAIRGQIRPKLETLGAELLTAAARVTGGDAYAHVAKHARRTVNPPDDTWVAFGPDKRGYKKSCHFKVAISRHCVRFLFEAGPEYAEKKGWLAAWKREAPRLIPALKKARDLAWFKNEHDEDPAALLADLSNEEIVKLAEELTRTRDGQLVMGRRVSQADAVKWGAPDYTKAIVATFEALAPLYRLR
jgi:uncharacterized protein YktB (UPF0637 family)